MGAVHLLGWWRMIEMVLVCRQPSPKYWVCPSGRSCSDVVRLPGLALTLYSSGVALWCIMEKVL